MKKVIFLIFAAFMLFGLEPLPQAFAYGEGEGKPRVMANGGDVGAAEMKENAEHATAVVAEPETINQLKVEKVALKGLCPVCVFKGKYMMGLPEHKVEFDGQIYYFVGEEQKNLFLENPRKYLDDIEKKIEELEADSQG